MGTLKPFMTLGKRLVTGFLAAGVVVTSLVLGSPRAAAATVTQDGITLLADAEGQVTWSGFYNKNLLMTCFSASVFQGGVETYTEFDMPATGSPLTFDSPAIPGYQEDPVLPPGTYDFVFYCGFTVDNQSQSIQFPSLVIEGPQQAEPGSAPVVKRNAIPVPSWSCVDRRPTPGAVEGLTWGLVTGTYGVWMATPDKGVFTDNSATFTAVSPDGVCATATVARGVSADAGDESSFPFLALGLVGALASLGGLLVSRRKSA